MAGSPDPKTRTLARRERRYKRKVASPKTWQRIADAKQGPCRITNAPAPNELHHVVARVHGGGDVTANIVPLSREAHDRVTRREAVACQLLLESLADEEYAYMVEFGGEDYAERAYGLRFDRG